MIRSFFAIDFPKAFGDELTRLIGLLKKADADVKWVRPGNVHLTLKFLGWVKEEALTGLTESAGPVISGFSACDLKAEGLGVFPSRNRARVVWVGLAGDLANLGGLQKAIEAEAARYDIESEDRPFAPHLTLGRVKSDRGPTRPAGAARPHHGGAHGLHGRRSGPVSKRFETDRGGIYPDQTIPVETEVMKPA